MFKRPTLQLHLCGHWIRNLLQSVALAQDLQCRVLLEAKWPTIVLVENCGDFRGTVLFAARRGLLDPDQLVIKAIILSSANASHS